MGVVLNLVKSWYLIIVILLLSLIIIVFHYFSPIIPLAFAVVWLLFAIIKQLWYRKVSLKKSEDKNVNELFDKMFADNQKGYKNVVDTVDEIIKNQTDK